ncbi:hypothetical protein CPC08DRAFT_824349 [Agrocybe pediades]|nr:hypothetical protein CPC08DRAFT_824349 [Agrocybe pediades]
MAPFLLRAPAMLRLPPRQQALQSPIHQTRSHNTVDKTVKDKASHFRDESEELQDIMSVQYSAPNLFDSSKATAASRVTRRPSSPYGNTHYRRLIPMYSSTHDSEDLRDVLNELKRGLVPVRKRIIVNNVRAKIMKLVLRGVAELPRNMDQLFKRPLSIRRICSWACQQPSGSQGSVLEGLNRLVRLHRDRSSLELPPRSSAQERWRQNLEVWHRAPHGARFRNSLGEDL